ncbi:MAG: RidA family protein [Bacteroidota bacterium]
MKKIINSEKAPAPIGPYNQSVKTGNLLFTSGQIAINPENNELVTSDIIAETHQVMKNLSLILAAAELDFSKVVKTSIFIRNMDDFNKINEVYASYFDEVNAPARETVQVERLPKDVSIEISLIAEFT